MELQEHPDLKSNEHVQSPGQQVHQIRYPNNWHPVGWEATDSTGVRLVELPLPADLGGSVDPLALAARKLSPHKVQHLLSAFPRLPLPEVHAALLLAELDISFAVDICRGVYLKLHKDPSKLDPNDMPASLWRSMNVVMIDCMNTCAGYYEGAEIAAEVDEVLKLIKDSGGDSLRAKVIKLESVQNPALWRRFSSKKKGMIQSLNAAVADLNERMLFHGTCSTTADTIAKEGFDVRRAVSCSYGRGTYFSDSSTTAFQFCRNKTPRKRTLDGECNFKMLLARVPLGRQCKGSSDMQAAPAGFDSVHSGLPSNTYTGSVHSLSSQRQHPYCHIIFDNDQAYPEYVITFKGS